ncbi:unnamed protein product [Wickerhamomyces anomalus]
MSNEIAALAEELKTALHQYPNFPSEGILFEDFLPIFRSPDLFKKLVKAFKLHLQQTFPDTKIDYIVGLESRGFLFGPSVALEIGAGFVPVRKQGKLPEGSNVIVIDDIIATGGSAAAAGELIQKSNANLLEFNFVMELDFLKGTAKLPAPSFTLISGQTEKLKN